MTPEMEEAATKMWTRHAVAARECLQALRYPFTIENCLPGEPNADSCGLPADMHAVAYFAALSALLDHYLGHIDDAGFKELIESTYKDATEIMHSNCSRHSR